ncbi:MAG: ROK family protein [Deltaproteobacteria bacterium]|nr:ROK family protein [Deltaproteobacteria bacterium]MBI2341232.1 ROK family protein [Deltaproteobacteria bacterium]MBI2974719.1 ROK family protein [Deltaproteobacteria bacterium]
MDKLAIGIDLGGTNCRFGAVKADGTLVCQQLMPVPKDRSHKGIISFLCSGIEMTKKKAASESSCIGIGAPGIVDYNNGSIVRSPHFRDWHNFELRKNLEAACSLPVALDNDANLVAAGEAWLGAGQDTKNFILITLGTGIGGGICIDGEIFHGDKGFAGEIGHQILFFDGRKCDCGSKGCWETVVSIDGLRQLIADSNDPRKEKFLQKYHRGLDSITPHDLHKEASDGDIFASLIWKKFGAYLGAGIASLVNILGIHTVIIGGGISNAWDFFISAAKKELSKRTYEESFEKIVIKKALLGETAGILGAAGIAFKMKNS